MASTLETCERGLIHGQPYNARQAWLFPPLRKKGAWLERWRAGLRGFLRSGLPAVRFKRMASWIAAGFECARVIWGKPLN